MKRLEDELRNAMRREEPPEGFVERTLARASAPRQNAWIGIFARQGVRWALAGALCLVLAVAGIEFKRAQVERARGEAAKAQLMLALRITADKLQLAQEKAQQHGIPLIY
jgi:hypothetical protein